jgi:hypothetical protein
MGVRKRSIEALPIPDNCDAKPYAQRADQCPAPVIDVILNGDAMQIPSEAFAPRVLADAICLSTRGPTRSFFVECVYTPTDKKALRCFDTATGASDLCASKRSVVIGPGVLVSPAGASDYLGGSSGRIHVRHTRRQSLVPSVCACSRSAISWFSRILPAVIAGNCRVDRNSHRYPPKICVNRCETGASLSWSKHGSESPHFVWISQDQF